MNPEITPVLKHICNCLAASGEAYKNYLQKGKTYFWAKKLMKYNSAILAILTAKDTVLTNALQADVELLVFHYKAWTEKWLALEKELNPADDDEFVFENNHTFPRQAALNFEAALNTLKENS